jgi:two-component system response regulator NreC
VNPVFDEPAISEGTRLKVVIADDHAILRDGLAMLIGAQGDMEVVGQASNGREAVQLAKSLSPDVVVMDVSMPDLGGAEATEQIREACPDVRVLALTRHADQGYLRRLLQAGAAGYVLKKSAADALINALRVVAGGGTYIEPTLAGSVVERALGSLGKTRQDRDMLTLREDEVLRWIAWGRSNKEIAASLAISIKTVESYKASATQKLALRSRSDIMRYALARGWLAADKAPE